MKAQRILTGSGPVLTCRVRDIQELERDEIDIPNGFTYWKARTGTIKWDGQTFPVHQFAYQAKIGPVYDMTWIVTKPKETA